jgi:xylulokinase
MFLGLDIGTSSVKAVLMDETGHIVEVASEGLEVSSPHALWREQNPEDWVTATLTAIDALKSKKPQEVAAIRGIGLSGQMHGAVLLDSNGQVLRPAILWNDGRSGEECQILERDCPDLHAIAGNLAMPGFTAPKLVWVARHEPEIFVRVAHVLLPKAYVRYRLTGEMVEDMSDASGTLWLDVEKRAWSDTILAATKMTRAQMPRLVEGSERSADLSVDLAARWGMSAAPVVAGGAGDCAASAVGLGAITPGDAFLSLGTSGVLFAVTDRFAPNPASAVHAFCHAIPNTWHQMGVMLSSGDSLAWGARVLGAPERELLAPLGETVAGPSPVQFLPYLSGERTPLNDPQATGGFLGLTNNVTRNDLAQAILEGVAFASRANLEALAKAGTALKAVDLVGGGSRSNVWAQILADTLQIAVTRVEEGEVGAALGAARLGQLAATGVSPHDVCLKPKPIKTFTPRAEVAAAYSDAYQRWSRLYPALKEART